MNEEGVRIGRFVLFRDVNGRLHALSAAAVAAICEDDAGGSVLMLPGGRIMHVDQSVTTVAKLLSGHVSVERRES